MVKRLSDLTAYKGNLPYASELFGIYQPLLGWKSKRVQKRVIDGASHRVAAILAAMTAKLRPDFAAKFAPAEGASQIVRLLPANAQKATFAGVVTSELRKLLPADAPAPAVWDQVLQRTTLEKILTEQAGPRAIATYRARLQSPRPGPRSEDPVARAETEARAMLARESRSAGLLQLLRENRQYTLLESLFYKRAVLSEALWGALQTVYDPFATIDPESQLDRVGLSPVGLAHLFRQYFFELDTFLGSPVGHVWLSPGSTVELVEVHTRRVMVEQSVEQALESIHKSEKSLTQQDELSDAVKQDNRSDMKFGVNASASQTWGWGSASQSASFDLGTTQEKAREQTHKTMRQQSEKLSEEIKENFKTTFRTVTETTDLSSKRYTLANATDKLINYELRRKMRQVAVQVQDIGSYLCWQTYVDDPGSRLGISELVHVGAPPDLSKLQPPDLVVPAQPVTEEQTITIPFLPKEGAGNDQTYQDGVETSLGVADSEDHIIPDVKQGPVKCSLGNFRLVSVTVDAQGADAAMSVDPKTIVEVPGQPGAYTYNVHLDNINFQGANSLPAKAILNWEPPDDSAAIKEANEDALAKFTARELELFRSAFVEASRTRIKLASNIQPRKAEDLREEERIVIYRALIQDMLEPEKLVPQPDAQTQHVVAELLNSIFDVDKLLYFVAPEWWRPRLHHSHQELGGLDVVTDPVTGNELGVAPKVPKQDIFSWGEAGSREDNYFITEESTPARLGSSLGWLLQLDADNLRNAFLNAPWVKAVLPIRPGRERAALNWLKHVEGTNGIGPQDMYAGPEPEWRGQKTVFQVLEILADRVRERNEKSMQTQAYTDPIDPASTVSATPVDRVYEHGFDPLLGGFRAHVEADFEIFDQWIEVLPTDQVAVVEVEYDPKTGRQL